MATKTLGLIMHGVTGRMGLNQHLIRSICAIRAQGGVTLANGDTVMPDPILVGRNEAKLAQLAKANGVTRWTTDLNAARVAEGRGRLLLSGEDLTAQAGLAVQQDTALAASLGVTHIERNGHHYVDGFDIAYSDGCARRNPCASPSGAMPKPST